MSDQARFVGLKKLPADPVLPMLAAVDVALETPVVVPETASAAEVLGELDAQRGLAATAEVDMIRVLAQALPRREAVWWSCLAGRDLVGRETELTGGCLFCAEAWVFKPGEETRQAAFDAMTSAKPLDNTSLCAMAAVYSTGTMGPGDLEASPVPSGVFGHVVFGMVMTSLDVSPEGVEIEWMGMQIDRALEIARGGNGKDVPAPGPLPPDPDDDDD